MVKMLKSSKIHYLLNSLLPKDMCYFSYITTNIASI